MGSGTIPGVRRFTSVSSLPARVFDPLSRRRHPVLLHSVARHGALVELRLAHFPLLQRARCAYQR